MGANNTKQIIDSINFSTDNYNPNFKQFLVFAGLITAFKLSLNSGRLIYKSLTHRPLSLQKFQDKYGQNKWAIITDVKQNQEYCMYLAQMEMNLILMGDEEDIKIVRSMIDFKAPSCQTKIIPIDWNQRKFHYDFIKQFQNLEISILVLPRVPSIQAQNQYGSHNQPVFIFEHHFLLLRYLGDIIRRNKNQKGAIIFPSQKDIERIMPGHGVKMGIKNGIQWLMKMVRLEYEGQLDIICSRGSAKECFSVLGKQVISE